MIGTSKRYIIYSVFTIFLVVSCNDSAASDPNTDSEPQMNLPGKVQGTLPINGEPCSEFEEVDGELSKALIFFEWDSTPFAQNYEIRIFNGGNQVFIESTSSLASNAILDKGKSYTWSIIAKNAYGETTSDTFSFTTPGEPIGNFAPYAAQITLNFASDTTEMSISWIGSDEDGDTLTYDVRLWENDELFMEFNDLTISSLDPISVNPTYTYMVEVVSIDNPGNFSISKATLIY